MASTFGGLNTMVRGLYAQQIALSTVGHNIASADKDGYSRQSVSLMNSTPEEIYGGHGSLQLGTGVLVNSINRNRDTFVDRQMWKESATLGYGSSLYNSLSKIEEVFQEPDSKDGMQGVMNQFWSAWQTLGTNASIESGGRTLVIQRGQELVDTIQNAGQKFYDQVADVNSVIDLRVKKVNEMSSEIFSLNQQISSIEMGNKGQANDLRDTRDYLVDQMSKMLKVTVNEDQYGNYTIQSGGITLVSATDTMNLATASTTDEKYGYEVKKVVAEGSNRILDLGSGEIKALIDVRDSEEYGLKGYLDKLDTMSKFLLRDFNDVHKSGYDVNNQQGDNFFGMNGVNYHTADDGLPAGMTGTWLSNLKMNSELLKENGAAKVAAKTLATITQSNANGGPAALSLSGTYTGGTTEKKYTVVITGVDAAGKVTGASYSTDNGATWTAATANPDGTFALPDNVNIEFATDKENTASVVPGTIKDTYKFSMPPQNNAAGDNAYRLAQSMKADIRQIMGETYTGTLPEDVSLDSYYSSFIGSVGVQTENAERLSNNQQIMVNQITNWRESTSGVNLDEELTNMIRFQKGYSSAARVITTIDEMLDKLINGTGVVGR